MSSCALAAYPLPGTESDCSLDCASLKWTTGPVSIEVASVRTSRRSRAPRDRLAQHCPRRTNMLSSPDANDSNSALVQQWAYLETVAAFGCLRRISHTPLTYELAAFGRTERAHAKSLAPGMPRTGLGCGLRPDFSQVLHTWSDAPQDLSNRLYGDAGLPHEYGGINYAVRQIETETRIVDSKIAGRASSPKTLAAKGT